MSSLDSILDNQEITNEIMTAIAVDLGADDITFSVNEKFGADKLNSITADLVTSGILLDGNKCEISVVNNKIYIDTGIMVFADGKKKTITSKTEIADVQDCYLYAYNNTIQNSIDIILNDSFPTNTDIVKLAKITDDTVRDMRKFATAKAVNNTANVYQNISLSFSKIYARHLFNGTFPERIKLLNNGFKYLIIRSVTLNGSGKRLSFNFFDLEGIEEFDCDMFGTSSTEFYLRVKRELEYISFACVSNSNTTYNEPMTCELLLL